MRVVMATVLVLLAAGYVASQAGLPTKERERNSTFRSATTVAPEDGWRRTVHGWEHCENWLRMSPAQATQRVKLTLHPVALASAQILAVTGLWLMTRLVGKRRDEVMRRTECEHARSLLPHSAGA